MSSKYKRKGRAKFLMLEKYMLESEAYRSLTPVERCAYQEVKFRFDGFNNGAIGLSCRELAAGLGCSKATAARALEILQQRGFVEVAKRSAFSVKIRVSTEWRLTEFKCDMTGELPTKAFMRWRPEEKNTVSQRGRTVSPQGQFQSETGVRYA